MMPLIPSDKKGHLNNLVIRSGRSVQNELLANLLNNRKESYYFYAVLLNKPSQNSVHDISFLIFWRNMRTVLTVMIKYVNNVYVNGTETMKWLLLKIKD